jgi:hypothetical protein
MLEVWLMEYRNKPDKLEEKVQIVDALYHRLLEASQGEDVLIVTSEKCCSTWTKEAQKNKRFDENDEMLAIPDRLTWRAGIEGTVFSGLKQAFGIWIIWMTLVWVAKTLRLL